MEISGKTALVTGTGQGIGAAVADLLGAGGATVAAVDANSATVEAVVAHLAGRGAEASAHAADVADAAVENVVSPGSTDTEMQRSMWSGDDGAEAVAFLVSDRAGHITMHDLYVDGGATLRA